MKTSLILFLIAVGVYWLIGHSAPFPFNHDQFGLYNHDIHRMMGVVFFITAGIVTWKWKAKK